MKKLKSDVVIVGCGVAGLYCALKLPVSKKITIITKAKVEECDSYLAQGGICMLKDKADYKSFYEDTMRAGHYENKAESVDIMIKASQQVIKDLVHYGTRFEREADGSFKFTREGAHSTARILFHEDITGKEITSHLLEAVKKLPNVTIYEDSTMIDITKEAGFCNGVIAVCPSSSPLALYACEKTLDGKSLVFLEASCVVWACGGIGGLYEHSTNFPHLTGDALGIALKHNIPLKNPDYIQIHPTTLWTKQKDKKERAFLISESVRGEGGILLDKKGNRFVNELLPRDVVANAIFEQMKKDKSEHVWLSMENIDKSEITNHFKHIYEKCLEEGYDCTKEPIPVVPAQHYFMGGVDVDSNSMTSLKALYAVGETSCNGVHGKNRLASNSLLESLVFASRAANDIVNENYKLNESLFEKDFEKNIKEYKDTDKIFADYKVAVINEIKRMKAYHEQNNNGTECRQFDSASA